MIDLLDVRVSYSGQEALDGLSLHVSKGALLGVIGPGACGKSTMCRVIAGLVQPDSGEVFVNRCNFRTCSRHELQTMQRNIGVQFQNDALFEHLSVLDNVAYPLTRLTAMAPSEIEGRAMESLATVGLAGFENRLPNRLSGGQRRRVALARACITRPAILICDEPTAGLDPQTSRTILDMIAGIRYQTKSTVVVVSSDVVGLFSISSRIALVWNGKIIEEDSTTVIRQSERAEVQRFLDDARLPFAGWTWD
ncbi:MAG: ATP-binding cassette domain-containing protein [Deltaproteobacteria bacterium]|nr:ATP-binding cassette domain-containing protein [Deltaproteobacteria bacterium]